MRFFLALFLLTLGAKAHALCVALDLPTAYASHTRAGDQVVILAGSLARAEAWQGSAGHHVSARHQFSGRQLFADRATALNIEIEVVSDRRETTFPAGALLILGVESDGTLQPLNATVCGQAIFADGPANRTQAQLCLAGRC